MTFEDMGSAIMVALLVLLGVVIGQGLTKDKAVDQAGWVLPAETVNVQSTQHHRLHKRINREGEIELVWLDGNGEDGKDKQ